MANRALLVGINDYRNIGDLKGCLNDITNMRNILKTYLEFKNEDIRVLADDRATKSNILHRLESMVSQAQPGDFLVFQFAGHGSQIRDREGDELKDHMDELICPWDLNWENGFITDDVLNEVLKELPNGVLLEVFLDCCHSGTGLRHIDLGRPAELGPENPTLIRYISPPTDINCRYEGEEDELKPNKGFSSKDRSTINHILWASCQANQPASDAPIKGTYNGAFTYYFCKHMRDTGGNINRKDLLKRIRNSLRHNGYSQIPQLECNADHKNARALTREERE